MHEKAQETDECEEVFQAAAKKFRHSKKVRTKAIRQNLRCCKVILLRFTGRLNFEEVTKVIREMRGQVGRSKKATTAMVVQDVPNKLIAEALVRIMAMYLTHHICGINTRHSNRVWFPPFSLA